MYRRRILQGLAETTPPVERYTINVYGRGAIEASACHGERDNGDGNICARGATFLAYWATVWRG